MYILNMFASGVINGERGLLIYIFTFVANGSATGTSNAPINSCPFLTA